MERQYVESTDLASVGYDGGSSLLEIEFHSGGIYQYFSVPQPIYEGLMQASSKGKYFNQFIKKTYGYSKVG